MKNTFFTGDSTGSSTIHSHRSKVQYPTSNIQHPASNIQHPISNIQSYPNNTKCRVATTVPDENAGQGFRWIHGIWPSNSFLAAWKLHLGLTLNGWLHGILHWMGVGEFILPPILKMLIIVCNVWYWYWKGRMGRRRRRRRIYGMVCMVCMYVMECDGIPLLVMDGMDDFGMRFRDRTRDVHLIFGIGIRIGISVNIKQYQHQHQQQHQHQHQHPLESQHPSEIK